MDYGLGWSIGLKRLHKVGCFLSKKLTKWYFLHFLSWLSPIFGTGILMMTFVQTAGVLLPNGSHRSCCKRIFIFVKIFKKYFFYFYIYISTPTAGVFLSSNIYLWKDIQQVFLVFLLFYISKHQRLVFFRPTAVTEAATKQYNWLALAIHHGLSSGSSKLYFSFSANHISRYNSILEYSNIFCDFLVNSIIV